jgi:ATP-dependent DNA helicase RecG
VIDPCAAGLDQIPCTVLKGVGARVANYLKKLNIHNLQDLLFHLPLRYEDRTCSKPLNQLMLGEHVQVEGQVIQATVQEGRRKSLCCRISDERGFLTLRFFYFNSAQVNLLNRPGQRIQCYGEIRRGKIGYEMVHPEYHFLDHDSTLSIPDTLTPVYPTTEGLHQHTFRKITEQALQLLSQGALLTELLPQSLLDQFGFLDLVSAIHFVHRPPTQTAQSLLERGQHPAQQRLAFEELLAHQISLASIRLRIKIHQAPQIKIHDRLVRAFLQNLPYQLTKAQLRVIDEIVADIQGSGPMLRLVQGDVGSGKTVVAAVAAMHMIECGYQVAIMAPTELLAEQHFQTFTGWCEPIRIRIAWLTGSSRGKSRAVVQESIKEGSAHIIIGTHAIFQSEILYKNLGLIIIDEQHRFGVSQRLALLEKGMVDLTHPHQLVMSATPIPRTLAMTAYADLDCSIIDELPPGRTPVKTIVLPSSKRQHLISRIRENCQQGAQAYWVCTLIQESEILQCQAAQEVTKELQDQLPELKIGLIHGRMKSKEKEQTMQAFKDKRLDLLVATTVIEVGVDVPNASLMIIENAERLGLAQLHQLRGRVGRGSKSSFCVLLYQIPLSILARERLAVLRDYTDGFIIAEKDLELRGPGEVLGTKQTGLVQLRIADLARDQDQLPHVQKAAQWLLRDHPERAPLIVKRWLGDSERFSEV